MASIKNDISGDNNGKFWVRQLRGRCRPSGLLAWWARLYVTRGLQERNCKRIRFHRRTCDTGLSHTRQGGVSSCQAPKVARYGRRKHLHLRLRSDGRRQSPYPWVRSFFKRRGLSPHRRVSVRSQHTMEWTAPPCRGSTRRNSAITGIGDSLIMPENISSILITSVLTLPSMNLR